MDTTRKVELGIASPTVSGVRLTLTANGKMETLVMSRRVAAGIAKEIVSALAE